MFQQVTEVFGLQGLIGGTPEASIFQFSFCLLLYNVMQTIRGFVAMHQDHAYETISIENLFRDTQEELTALTVLVRRGVLKIDESAAPSLETIQNRLNELLKYEWRNSWIKA